MAQIVVIDTGSKRVNNEIGDIVAIHEDDVELTGSGYVAFKIMRVDGMAQLKLEQSLVSEKEGNVSKYSYNLTLSKTDIDSLKNSATSEADKILILKKITAKD